MTTFTYNFNNGIGMLDENPRMKEPSWDNDRYYFIDNSGHTKNKDLLFEQDCQAYRKHLATLRHIQVANKTEWMDGEVIPEGDFRIGYIDHDPFKKIAHRVPAEQPNEGKAKTIDYIHKGIEFAKKEQFKLSGESYRSGVGFGYSCGYQDGINSPTLPGSDNVEEAAKEGFQDRVNNWILVCFGEAISRDKQERNHRFIEEALELVQSCGATESECQQLVSYVFGRPAGEMNQEIGGVMVTLAALCNAQDKSMNEAGETELERIWTKVDAIRNKQAAKPKHSPLPASFQPPPAEGNGGKKCKCDGCFACNKEKENKLLKAELGKLKARIKNLYYSIS